MIQDIGNHIFCNTYQPTAPKQTDYILFFQRHSVYCKVQELLLFPTIAEAENILPGLSEQCIFLFSLDEHNYYLSLETPMEALSLPDFSFEDVSIFRCQTPKEVCFALITGFHLFCWYQSRRFCGSCGHKLMHDTKERMMYCPSCQSTEYPKISPAVIIAVRNGNKLLMSKYAGRNAKRYALLAGFSEIGETLEQTVEREVMEEVGLKVKNIQYYKSQPWGLSGTLLAGFYCDLDGDSHITLEEEELAMAQWFERKEIPYEEYDVSLTREMMLEFKKENY